MDKPIERPPPRPAPRYKKVLLAFLLAVLAMVLNWNWQLRQKNQHSTWHGDPVVRLSYEEGQRGQIMLPASADGVDAGPCFLDSGADALTITPAAARKAKLRIAARLPWAYIRGSMGGSSGIVPNRTAAEFRVGPLAIKRPILAEIAESPDSVSGKPFGSVCSKDIFHAAVVGIDWRTREITFYKPDLIADHFEGLNWIPLIDHGGRPYMKLRFGRHEGLFLIDTGMDYPIHFHRHVVDDFDLLAGRASTPSEVRGLGASGSVRVRQMQGVQFAQYQIGSVQAGFDTEHRWLRDRKYSGMIGRGLLRNFRTIIDLPNKRAAFVAYEPAQAPVAK